MLSVIAGSFYILVNVMLSAILLSSLMLSFYILSSGILIVAIKPVLPGVNFTNILRAAFCKKVFCAAFMCSQFGLVMFWHKDFGAKAAH